VLEHRRWREDGLRTHSRLIAVQCEVHAVVLQVEKGVYGDAFRRVRVKCLLGQSKKRGSRISDLPNPSRVSSLDDVRLVRLLDREHNVPNFKLPKGYLGYHTHGTEGA
jgi:hypothetical protein